MKQLKSFGMNVINYLINMSSLCHLIRLGVVVVRVLTTGSKGPGFKPDRGNRFLNAIQIRSTLSFEREVNLEAPCREILRSVKEPCVVGFRYCVSKIQGHLSPPP
jgi:hypothetical protein